MNKEVLNEIIKVVKNRNGQAIIDVQDDIKKLSKNNIIKMFYIFTGLAELVSTDTDTTSDLENRIINNVSRIQEDHLGELTLREFNK